MTPRQARRAADLFTACVIVSVAIALAGLTWRLAARDTAPAAPPLLVATSTGTDITPILALAPFGNGASDAPQLTTLPIELRGIVSTAAAGGSSALIAPTGGRPLSYRVGDAIPAGATILTIGIDTVLLGVGGHRELLAFPKVGALAAVAGAAPALPLSGTTSVASSPAATAAASMTSSQSLLDSFGATPVNGGYRVGESLSPSTRQAGLLPGDVIEQVNGTLLGNPAMDKQVLAAAARSGSIRIDLTRAGRRISITVPLR